MKRMRGLSLPLIVGLCSIVGVFLTAGTARAGLDPRSCQGNLSTPPVLFGGITGSAGTIHCFRLDEVFNQFDTNFGRVASDAEFATTPGVLLVLDGMVTGTYSGNIAPGPLQLCSDGIHLMATLNGTLSLNDTAHNDGYDVVVKDLPLDCTEHYGEAGVGDTFTVTNGTGRWAGIEGGGKIAGPLSDGRFYTDANCGSLSAGAALSCLVGLPPPCTVSFAGCHLTIVSGSAGATIGARLIKSAPVGILVERIVGKGVVLVGRVPFGVHHKGRVRIRWDRRVNGKKLPKGRYRITLRALDAYGSVVGLAKPVTITIH